MTSEGWQAAESSSKAVVIAKLIILGNGMMDFRNMRIALSVGVRVLIGCGFGEREGSFVSSG